MRTEWAPLPAGYKAKEQKRPKVELKTFNDWSDAGYKILKGSKSVGRNSAGVALFSSEQVMYVADDWLGDPDESDDEYDPDLPGNPDDYGDR